MRAGAIMLVLVVAGVLAFVLVDKPWSSNLSATGAAAALGQRLHTPDRFVCTRASGFSTPGEPDWNYLCENATDPQRSGYFVKTNGNRIAQIQPSG